MKYKKRSESTIQKECLRYLQLLENKGDIIHFDRLNSGNIFVRYGTGGGRKIRLCREGTPDLYCFTKQDVIWIEVKKDNYKLRPDQAEFKLKAEGAGHKFLIVTSARELDKKLRGHL